METAVARAFVRWTIPLPTTMRATVTAAPDAMPGAVSAQRIEVDAGKLALSDIFDVNRYANSTRTQFLDWVLFNNGAWDCAADTRLLERIAVAWIGDRWSLRAASFQMPTFANGNRFDPKLASASSFRSPTTATPACSVASDGTTAGTRVSCSRKSIASNAGGQLSGKRWHRSTDAIGVAGVIDGLSGPHRRYLAAAGRGFLLGDGALRYAPETVGEAYYRLHVGRYLALSPDLLAIRNPGYNHDRGPAVVLTLRARVAN